MLCNGVFEVVAVTNLKDAIPLIDRADMVITDIHFPPMEGMPEGPYGIEVAKRCQERGIPYQIALGHHKHSGEINYSFEEERLVIKRLITNNLTGDSFQGPKGNIVSSLSEVFRLPLIKRGPKLLTVAYIAKGDPFQWLFVIARAAKLAGLDPLETCKKVLSNILKEPDPPKWTAEVVKDFLEQLLSGEWENHPCLLPQE